MRQLLITVFLVLSIGFSQDVLITQGGIKYKGEFVSSTDISISFKAEGMASAQSIPIEKIVSLVLKDGTIVIEDGTIVIVDRSYGSKRQTLNQSNILQSFGGVSIGLAGIILLYNNDRSIDSDATIEEAESFSEEIKSSNDLAYILLTVGGFLIAIDRQ